MTITDQPAASTEKTATSTGDVVDELNDWLEDNWDPDITLGEWWERLGEAGWANPMLPPESYGRAVTRGDSLRIARAIVEFGAVGAPAGLGLNLAAPTIATHGTREQIQRYVADIVTGRKAWCQLFSEPGAGSDLAGLTTRAEKDGELWRVNGQKVWTSGGHMADMGMLLARTNPDVPKHQGISWFAFDMHQDGVEVRPLKEMTGATMFSEVFMTDAEVADEARIGDVNNGWAVANTTLLWERSGMGAGGGGAARGAMRGPMARPGTVAGLLDQRVGDFAGRRRTAPKPKPTTPDPATARGAGAKQTSPAKTYIDLARRHGRIDDPRVRQDLMRLHIWGEIRRMSTERHKAVKAKGGDIPGIANFTKLAMADTLRLQRDLGTRIIGPLATLHGYTGEERDALHDALGGREELGITGQALSAQALPIYGGTDQVQRNVIGERVLGLPKEPGDLKNLPFSEIPKNG